MRKIVFLPVLLSTFLLSAVTFDLPEIKLDKAWKSRDFATSNGETVKLTFTATGSGKAAGLLATNSSKSTYKKFTVTPGENSHSITFPSPGTPLRSFVIHLTPQTGSRLSIKNLKVHLADQIRYGNFEGVRITKRGCTGWTADKSGVFRVAEGKVQGKLNGETFAWIKQWVYLPPDTVFTLAADVQAVNFKGNAGFELVFRGGGKGINKTLQHMPVTGDTHGIKRLYYTFKTPSKLKYCAIRLAAIKSSGELEFDNVELFPGNFTPQIPVSKDFSKALHFNGFFKYNRNGFKWEKAPALTRLSLATDNQTLVIKGICQEPLMSKLKAAKNNPDGFYANDNVEVFVDAQGMGRSCYQVIVTPHGEYQDLFNRDTTWKGAQVKTQINPADWRFEIRLPFEEMGYGKVEAQLPNKRLGIAVFRNRRTTGEVYSMPYWNKLGYRHPSAFLPVLTGNNDLESVIDPSFVALEGTAHTEPPMACLQL